MANKTETVRIRMEPELKAAAEAVFAELGLTASQAVNIFYKLVKAQQGIPFSLNVPNAETIKAMEDVKAGRGLTTYKSARELFDKYR